MQPEASLFPLQSADGSAAYSVNGYTVIAAVNGPLEVQRRDEIADEATIEVNVRPDVGVGGIRERHFESIVQRTLRRTILATAHPRSLIQVTLQVTASPQDGVAAERLRQSDSNLPLLPVLLQASMLALLTTTISLSLTYTSTAVSVRHHCTVNSDPSARDLSTAHSVHVLAFTTKGDIIVSESEGDFDLDTWTKAVAAAREKCIAKSATGSAENASVVDKQDSMALEALLRTKVTEKLGKENRWKSDMR